MLGQKKYLCVWLKICMALKFTGLSFQAPSGRLLGKVAAPTAACFGKEGIRRFGITDPNNFSIRNMFLWNYLSAQSCQDTVTPFLILCAIKSLCNCKISIKLSAWPINSICASAPLKNHISSPKLRCTFRHGVSPCTAGAGAPAASTTSHGR